MELASEITFLTTVYSFGLFVAKAIVVVIIIGLVISLLGSAVSKTRQPSGPRSGFITVTKLNDQFDAYRDAVAGSQSNPEVFIKQKKLEAKAKRKEAKAEAKKVKATKEEPKVTKSETDDETEESQESRRKSLFLLEFKGDIAASQAEALRQEITAVLLSAKKDDEILVSVESPGGVVHGYGFAASQLMRIKKAGHKLIVAVDQVAASGGYMMASVGSQIIAAPFALVGSIGVAAEIPNVNRLLKRFDVDYDTMTAGKYKRTLSIFGENTEEGREKFQEEIEDVHKLFADFVAENRETVEVDKVSTGEAWYGQRAIDLNLIDKIQTSDEYIMNAVEDFDILKVKWIVQQSLIMKLQEGADAAIAKLSSPFRRYAARYPTPKVEATHEFDA